MREMIIILGVAAARQVERVAAVMQNVDAIGSVGPDRGAITSPAEARFFIASAALFV